MTTPTPSTPSTPAPTGPGTAGSTEAASKRIYPLQWLRALAALAVVTFHAYQNDRTGADGIWPFAGDAHQLMLGTDLFVDMFFVLSAFVLWLPVARSAIAGEDGRPGRVLLFRRMARLLPLYLTVVLLVWAITNPELPGHWQDLLLHVTFTHVYSDEFIFWTNGPAWSLGVEFHFYVLMALAVPLVRAGVRRTSGRASRIALLMVLPLLCAVGGLGYLYYQVQVAQPSLENWSAWFNPLAKAPDFAIGMTLAVVAAAGGRLPKPARTTFATVGLAALGVLVMTRPTDLLVSNWWHPAYALAIAVALSAVVLHEPPYPAWMSWRPLAWIGGLGYGIYLIHEPVMRALGDLGLLPAAHGGATFLLTAAVTAVPTVLLAWLSSRTVEAAGLKTLAMLDRSGKPRDYYAHMPQPRYSP